MVQYRDLNAPPARMLADVVADMKAQERQSKTGDAGVKDLGETGDIIWPRWDGGEDSVREVSANVEAARGDIAELNEVILPELADELETSRTDLQQKLDAANARIDDIIVDGGGAGNFTTYSINEPTTEGAGEGDQWFRVVNGEVIGQWRWDGSVWQPVTLTDAIIAGIDLSKLVSNGNLSEVVANKMFADLFAANKITAQELAVGAVTAESIASGAIHADEIVGGSFTGETFEGGTFIGGEFRTSDTLPGRVKLADDAYVSSFGGVARPGISVEPEDASGFATLPGIGPEPVGMTIDGGRLTTGESSYITMFPTSTTIRSHRPDGTTGGAIQTSPALALIRTYREDGTTGGEIAARPESSLMRTYREDGTSGGEIDARQASSIMRTRSGNSFEAGWVRVQPQDAELAYVAPDNTYFSRIKTDASEAFLYTRAGGANRYLTVDADGVWVKTNKSGSWEQWNLEDTASDSGWKSFAYNTSTVGTGNPAYRIKGGVVFFRGALHKTSGTWASGWTVINTRMPEEIWPAANALRAGASSATSGMLLQMTGAGRFEVWLPTSLAGSTTVQLSPMFYPIG